MGIESPAELCDLVSVPDEGSVSPLQAASLVSLLGGPEADPEALAALVGEDSGGVTAEAALAADEEAAASISTTLASRDVSEQATAARLEEAYGDRISGFLPGAHAGVDFTAELDGQVVEFDAMGGPQAAAHLDTEEFETSLLRHVRKSDVTTVLDLTGFSFTQVASVATYLKTLPSEYLTRLIIIRA